MYIRKLDILTKKVIKILSSGWFLAFVITQFIIQSLWIAFNFRFPMLYDEKFHIGVIEVYAKQYSPFILNQPTTYDIYGNLANGQATIFHYLLSFPYRLVGVFTDSPTLKIIAMRILSILLFSLGIYVFYRLFKRLEIGNAYISVSLLVFSLIPMVPFVAATTNYDNMLFPLTAWYLLVCIKIIQSKHINWINLVLIIVIGCFSSLVKVAFLPIFAASVLYIAIVIFMRHGGSVPKKLKMSFVNTKSLLLKIGLLLATIITAGLFANAFLPNLIKYKTPEPSCSQTFDIRRCMSSSVDARNIQAETTRDQRPVAPLPDYALSWTGFMFRLSTWSGSSTTDGNVDIAQPLSAIYSLLFIWATLGLIVVTLYWRILSDSQEWKFLMSMVIVLILSLFILNAQSYYKLHAAYGNQPRYLISAIPILVVAIAIATSKLLKGNRTLLLMVLAIVMLGFTQGGGVISPILQSKQNWLWQNDQVINSHRVIQNRLKFFVKE